MPLLRASCKTSLWCKVGLELWANIFMQVFGMRISANGRCKIRAEFSVQLGHEFLQQMLECESLPQMLECKFLGVLQQMLEGKFPELNVQPHAFIARLVS